MKLQSLEGLDVSDLIPGNVHNMRLLAINNVFGTKAYKF